MKTLLNYPFLIYAAAAMACLCIMIIVDYCLGPEAEHLNAWVIVNRLLGRDVGIADSKAIELFGLAGAAILMLVLNRLFGMALVQIIRFAIQLFHS